MACYVFFCDLQWSPGYDRDFIITQGDAQVTQMEKANVAKAGAEAK